MIILNSSKTELISRQNIPDIYNLQNLETSYEDIIISIKVINNKFFSVKFNDINLKFDNDNDDNYDGEIDYCIDLYDILDNNGIFDIPKYKKLEDYELKAQFFTHQSKSIKFYIVNEDTNIRNCITNNTILDEMYMNELSINLANYPSNTKFGDFNEEYLNIKLSLKQDFTVRGNMYIKPCEHYNFRDKLINFYTLSNCPMNLSKFTYNIVPLFLTIMSLGNVSENNIEKIVDNPSLELLLKKITLPLIFSNSKYKEEGEIVCELYTFNHILFLYFMRIITPNNEVFNFRKECKICKPYQNKKNTKFNTYNSTCEHVLDDLVLFFKNNLKNENGTETKIQINIPNFLNEIKEYDNYKKYIIRTYGKTVNIIIEDL